MKNTFEFVVHGTHCASCEIVIERVIGGMPNVHAVSASSGKNIVTVTMNDGAVFDMASANALLKEHGYSIESRRADVAQTFSWDRVVIAAAVVFALWLVLTKTGVLNFAPSDATGKGLLAVFGVGLVAAMSSCTAVVSGLLFAISSRASERIPRGTFAQKMRPHVYFNVGRLVGFVGFGALVGLVGRAFELSSFANGILVLVLAILMIGIGVDLLHVLPTSVAIRPPKFLAHRIHALTASDTPYAPFVLGALTFFLPCGFTQSMQLYALSTGSPVQGAMIMGVFALGTLPAFLSLGAVTSLAKGKILRNISYVAGALVVALGITNVSNAATLLGFSGFSTSTNDDTSVSIALIDGKQIATMEVTAYGYAPNVIRVQKGIPVSWQIFGGNEMGCASTLVVPAFNVRASLHPGENTVAFTPTKAGTFPFSCSMGMVRGTMIVTN